MSSKCLISMIVGLVVLAVAVLSAQEIQDTAAQCEEVKMNGPYTFNSTSNPHDELAEVEKTIRASIEWAVHDKDTAMSYGSVVNNDELFFFQTDSRSTIVGFEDFRNLTEKFFMRDDFKAIKVVIKDLRIHMSPSMKTAWWACILDDYNEFQGKPANWENVRWSGVLEKVNDNWKIFQMHFSKAEDLITE